MDVLPPIPYKQHSLSSYSHGHYNATAREVEARSRRTDPWH
jgi:hypothetical protein